MREREREKAAGSQLNSNSQHGYHPGRKTRMLKQSYSWRQNPGKAKKQVNVTAKSDPSREKGVEKRREEEVKGMHINQGLLQQLRRWSMQRDRACDVNNAARHQGYSA